MQRHQPLYFTRTPTASYTLGTSLAEGGKGERTDFKIIAIPRLLPWGRLRPPPVAEKGSKKDVACTRHSRVLQVCSANIATVAEREQIYLRSVMR